jgi:hypothetical protein
MSPSDLIEAGERIYGKHWRNPLASMLGVNISTLRRWTSGDIAVPRSVELAVSLMAERILRGREP